MLCSRFLRVVHAKRGFAGLMDRAFDGLLSGYRWSLALVLRHRPVMLGAFVLILAATVHMYNIVPTGFIPDQDSDAVFVNMRAAQGTSYYDMSKWTQQVGDILIKDPNVDSFIAMVGGGGGSANNARLPIQLVPRADRQLAHSRIVQRLASGQILRFPGFRAFTGLPPALQIGGRQGNQNYSLMMQALNTDDLYTWAPQLEAAVTAQVPEVQDVSTDLEMKSPRINLVMDRDKAAAVGLNVAQIQNALYDGLGPKWSSTIYGTRERSIALIEMELGSTEARPDSLKNISFKTSNGVLVPLESVVSFKETVGPQSINHSGQLPSVSLSFGLRPGVSLGEATAHVKQVADRLLPATITTDFEGSAKVFEQSMQNLGLLLFVAIGVVYIVLGDAVRKLHSSTDDSLGSAIGRPSALW